MPTVRLDDIASLRRVLGVSQTQAAVLLGVSAKAIQAYEQGWRRVPASVQRSASLLLYTRWRKQNGTPAPCWQSRRCALEVRSHCPAFVHQAGDLCWMLTGTLCRGQRQQTAAGKLAQCRKCPVMTRWLKA